MKHASTRSVFNYWNERRGDQLVPERADIDPVAIRSALGDTFMLAADFVDQLRFRLAGTRVCALFAREIKGEAFHSLWSAASRQSIESLTTIVEAETTGAVAGATGITEDGAEIDLELLLLPLAHKGHARIRALGVLAPITVPYWLGEKPVVELELGPMRHVGPDLDIGTARFLPAADGSRLRRGFMVYTGGRAEPTIERS